MAGNAGNLAICRHIRGRISVSNHDCRYRRYPGPCYSRSSSNWVIGYLCTSTLTIGPSDRYRVGSHRRSCEYRPYVTSNRENCHRSTLYNALMRTMQKKKILLNIYFLDGITLFDKRLTERWLSDLSFFFYNVHNLFCKCKKMNVIYSGRNVKSKLPFSRSILHIRPYYYDLSCWRSKWALCYTLRASIIIESRWRLYTAVVNIFQICDTTLRGQYIKRIARQQSWICSQRHSCLSVCICFRNGRYLFVHRRVW